MSGASRMFRKGPVALCAIAALACGGEPAAGKGRGQGRGKGEAGPASAGQATAAREVRLVRVAPREMARTVAVTGTLAPDEQVTVGVKVPGRLASIAVDLGSVVKRDQAIAQIETTDYQLRVEQAASGLAQARALLGLPPEGDDDAVDVERTSLVQEARATLEETRANLERARTLVEQRLIPPADFDASNAAFVRAESALAKARDEVRNRQAALRQRRFELRAARQQLADATMRSPLDGTVQQRHALAGEFLQAGAKVATIVRVNPLRLLAQVPERDAASLRAGQSVSVAVDGDDARYTGRVVRLAPALTEQNRALPIEAEIENPGKLRPGSFARAEIVVDDASKVTAVPTSSIVTFAGIEKVITVEQGRAVEKPITTGRRSERWTEVLSGVAPGEAVVVEPGNLQQGQPVIVAGTS
jgi:multidrug efflux pump subunit AcrA (membrane-fusion protein)